MSSLYKKTLFMYFYALISVSYNFNIFILYSQTAKLLFKDL